MVHIFKTVQCIFSHAFGYSLMAQNVAWRRDGGRLTSTQTYYNTTKLFLRRAATLTALFSLMKISKAWCACQLETFLLWEFLVEYSTSTRRWPCVNFVKDRTRSFKYFPTCLYIVFQFYKEKYEKNSNEINKNEIVCRLNDQNGDSTV